MILTIQNKWEDGSSETKKYNYTAKRGRYILASMRSAVQFKTKPIPDGFEYETPKHYCGNAGKCVTTITLTSGWC